MTNKPKNIRKMETESNKVYIRTQLFEMEITCNKSKKTQNLTNKI